MSDLAVDGNSDGRWLSGSCSHTLLEDNPWFRVDLQRNVSVGRVSKRCYERNARGQRKYI